MEFSVNQKDHDGNSSDENVDGGYDEGIEDSDVNEENFNEMVGKGSGGIQSMSIVDRNNYFVTIVLF
jgi:hypothetical protein